MRTISIKSLWPFRCDTLDPTVIKDADQLVRVYGEQAYETAAMFSWREDIGLLFTRTPGHWHRVRLEIGHRTGKDTDTDRRIYANIQALHLM